MRVYPEIYSEEVLEISLPLYMEDECPVVILFSLFFFFLPRTFQNIEKGRDKFT